MSRRPITVVKTRIVNCSEIVGSTTTVVQVTQFMFHPSPIILSILTYLGIINFTSIL